MSIIGGLFAPPPSRPQPQPQPQPEQQPKASEPPPSNGPQNQGTAGGGEGQTSSSTSSQPAGTSPETSSTSSTATAAGGASAPASSANPANPATTLRAETATDARPETLDRLPQADAESEARRAAERAQVEYLRESLVSRIGEATADGVKDGSKPADGRDLAVRSAQAEQVYAQPREAIASGFAIT